MRFLRQVAVLVLLAASSVGLHAGDVIDRIVATVGKRAILQSELEERIRFEAFSAGKALNSVAEQDVRAALDRVIDQQLIASDIGNAGVFVASEEDVKSRVAEIRTELGAGTDEGWKKTLHQYGLTEAAVTSHVRAQLDTMRMVNQKLRPSVRVEQAEIEAAYRDEFLPKLRQAGAKDVPLAEVTPRIRQILVERKIGELLESWLQGLRSDADVRIELEPLATEEGKPANETVVGTVPPPSR